MNYIEVERLRRRSDSDIDVLRRAVAAANAESEWWQPTGNVFSVATPAIVLDGRRYQINDEIVCAQGGEKFLAHGDAVIEQLDPTKRSLVFTTAYAHSIEGIRFLGGATALHFENGNIDSQFTVRRCDFMGAQSYAISGSRSGGAPGFISAALGIHDSRFMNCKQVLDTPFDRSTLDQCWVQWGGPTYMAANTAAFRVRENAVLNLNRMFGIPGAGDGVNRLAGVRWVDLQGTGGVLAHQCRFGGEFAGMPIVYHSAPLPTAYPWIGPQIVLEASQLSCGLSGGEDSGVVYLQGSVPQHVVIRDCTHVVDAPFIKKAPTFDLDAWLDAKNVNNRIRLDLSRAGMHWNDGNPIPPELLPFVV